MTPNTDAPLTRLEQILEEEAEALRTVDVRGIGPGRTSEGGSAARTGRGPRRSDDARRARPASGRIRDRARQNQVRLAATLSTVRGLLRALVNEAPPSYGPRSEPAVSRPVLASEIG